MKRSRIFEFAEQLARIQIAISERSPRAQMIDRSIPGVWMALNAAAATPYPSSNPNRALAMPGGEGWQDESAARCVRRFREAGAARFFFWLSEYSNSETIAKDLAAAGMKRFDGPSYPVLARSAAFVAMPETSLEIRAFDAACDSEAMGEYPDEAARLRVLNSPKLGDEQCFIAWSAQTPVAVGAVTIGGSIAYINAGGTLKEFRNRGAQSALIAARINYACERGCGMLASETISILKSSLGNLQRQGFEIIFEKRVFDGGESV